MEVSRKMEWLAGWRDWVRFAGRPAVAGPRQDGWDRAAKANENLETGNRPTIESAYDFCPYVYWSVSAVQNHTGTSSYLGYWAPGGSIEATSAKEAVEIFAASYLEGPLSEGPSPFADVAAFKGNVRDFSRTYEFIAFVKRSA